MSTAEVAVVQLQMGYTNWRDAFLGEIYEE